MNEEGMLKWFEYAHLPEHLQDVSSRFHQLASWVCDEIETGPERTVALRKLLEAKDAAVRAKLHPGGYNCEIIDPTFFEWLSRTSRVWSEVAECMRNEGYL